MIGLEELIGKTIKDAEVNKSLGKVELTTDKGVYTLWCEGDCCSNSDIIKVSGEISICRANVPIDTVEDLYIDIDDQEDFESGSQGEDRFTTLKIVSGDRSLEVVVRNSSNGYYSNYWTIKKKE